MDLVHVVRHKVLVEGRTQRAVARELGLARVTVRKYVDQAVPTRKSEAKPRPRPVWDAVAERVQALLAESVRWTGGKQRLTPAMEAGLADHVWAIEEIVAILWSARERARVRRAATPAGGKNPKERSRKSSGRSARSSKSCTSVRPKGGVMERMN